MPYLARITQWQSAEFIYAEILNKTSMALLFTSDISYIYLIYYQVFYRCYFSLCFVAWHHIYSIFDHDLPRLFPLFVLGYRRVKHIKFNRTFPVSSLSFLFTVFCNFRFELRVGLLIFVKKRCLNENGLHYGSSSEIHVHYCTVWVIVNCWIRSNDLCCRLCKMFCLSE